MALKNITKSTSTKSLDVDRAIDELRRRINLLVSEINAELDAIWDRINEEHP